MTREQEQEVLNILRNIRNEVYDIERRIQNLCEFIQKNTSNTIQTELKDA